MVHSEPTFFGQFRVDFCPKLCVIFTFKTPIYVMRENFHLSCRGSNKAQEGGFGSSHSGGGGGGVGRVFPRMYFEQLMQILHS